MEENILGARNEKLANQFELLTEILSEVDHFSKMNSSVLY